MIARAVTLALAFSCAAPAWGQADATEPAVSPADAQVKGADVELMRAVREVTSRIAGILQAPKTPTLLAVRADESIRVEQARVRALRLLPASVAAARGRAWSDLGLGTGSEPAELVEALALDVPGMTFDAAKTKLLVDPSRLTGDESAGNPYEDEDATLFHATGVAPDEPIVGHYAAHLLIDGADPDGVPTTDAYLAKAALAEGSANVAALVLLFGGVGLESEVVAGKLRPDDVLGGRLVATSAYAGSSVVTSFLQFVYLDGFAQTAALAKRGDVRRLAQERKQRRTTRDVIHTDRAPAVPVEIPLPAIPESLGLVPVDRDALGEEGIIVLVSLLTGKDNLGLIAGDGWLADSLWRYEPPGGGAGMTVWVSRWQTAEEAKDFAYSLERCLQARFPGVVLQEPGAGTKALERADRSYRLELDGTEVRFRVAEPAIERRIQDAGKKKSPTPSQPPKKK
jgi:hypothetical protein